MSMFCPQCGTKLPDGSAFCSQCGASTKQGAPAPAAKPQPAQKPAPATPKKMPQIHVTELFDRVKPHLILVTTVISLLLILFGIVHTLNKPFYQIPFASLALTASGEGDEAVDELLDSIDENIDDMEDELDYNESRMDDDEVKAVEKVIKSMEKIRNNFSIHNFRAFVDLAEDIDEEFNSGFDHDEIREIQSIMNVLVAVIWTCFILPVLFTVLGGLKKSAALTIIGMVFTTISQLTVCGLVWVILSLAVGVYRVMLCKQAKAKKVEPTV